MKKLFTLVLFCLLPTVIFASLKPLPVDQAFSLSAEARDNQTLLAIWNIAPGYYLYRDRIHFTPVNPHQDSLAQPIFPQTTHTKYYPEMGKLAVYEGLLTIPIPVIQSHDSSLALKIHYQGCSASGFCYPPTTRIVQLDLNGPYGIAVMPIKVDLAPSHPTQLGSSPENRVLHLLNHANIFAILAGFWLFGFLISLTPCVLPMIPILSSIIVGQGKISHMRSFGLSLAYVLGMAITYAVAGVLFGVLGSNLQATLQKPWLIILFSLIFVGMAFSLFGLFTLQLPEALRSRVATISHHQKSGSYWGAGIMGILSTLLLSPCVTPPLVGVLGYISQTGNAALGGITLFVMGIGMGTPLLIIGASSAKLLPKSGAWMNTIKNILGVLMLLLAIWMLERLLPSSVILGLCALLSMGCAVALGALSSTENFSQLIRKLLGLILFVYGIVLMISIYFGNTSPLTPFHFPRTQMTAPTAAMPSLFKPVKTLADVKKQLEQAKQSRKIVLLDFYADWCIACKEMDHLTFNDPKVRQALKPLVVLRADVTKNDAFDQALEKAYGVVAPPTLLFFYRGHEIRNTRIVGEISAKAFLQHLRALSHPPIR